MVVEIDINVKCPACGNVMVRNLDHVACGMKACKNYGVKYELPKLTLKRKPTKK